jgi:hypothetical protein
VCSVAITPEDNERVRHCGVQQLRSSKRPLPSGNDLHDLRQLPTTYFLKPFDIYQLNERFIWCLLCTTCTVYFMTFFLYSLYIGVFTKHPRTVQTFGHHCLDTELTFQRRRPVQGVSSTPCQTIPHTTESDLEQDGEATPHHVLTKSGRTDSLKRWWAIFFPQQRISRIRFSPVETRWAVSLKTCGGAPAFLPDLFVEEPRFYTRSGSCHSGLYNIHIQNRKAILAGPRWGRKGLQNAISLTKCTQHK